MPKKNVCDEIRFVMGHEDNDDAPPLTPVNFRIVSWNTLADQYIHYQRSSRPNANFQIFNQNRRHSRLGQVFQHFVDLNVDFICLQEVDFKMARQMLVDKNSYTRLLTPTGHGRGDTRVDACCIFYKSADWKIVGTPDMIDLNDLAGKDPSASTFTKSLARGNFGMIATFQHRSLPQDSPRVVICNTHLYWNPKYEYVKLCQAHYLCLRAQKVLDQDPHIQKQFLFCGDLNSKIGELVHTYLSMGEVDTPTSFPEMKQLVHTYLSMGEVDTPTSFSEMKHTPNTIASTCWNRQAELWLVQQSLECPLRHLLLQSAYAKDGHGSSSLVGETMEFTNSTTDFCGVIDYIFYSSCTLKQTKSLFVPYQSSKEKGEPPILPSKSWPSDHLAIGAEFQLG